MRKQGELKIEILEKGLAQISLRGREAFLLRYPDPVSFHSSNRQSEDWPTVTNDSPTLIVKNFPNSPTHRHRANGPYANSIRLFLALSP